ncbi:acetate kinase [bacterium]|nr:acetate kinase [bacterium]
MNILVLNTGSSSVKFQVIETNLELIEKNADRKIASGLIDRIGSESIITFRVHETEATYKQTAPIRDHKIAVDKIIKWIVSKEANLSTIKSLTDIHAVGHRVVHGGETLTASVLLDDAVIREIEDCIELAPLHNPANLKGIYAVQEIFGKGIKQVAVFDTAFHHTIPDYAYLYAIPYQLYRRYKIRRYGFHGTSHRYVAYRYRTINHIEKDKVNLITLHLGNGCSICAIKNGKSFDTSMGMTPLEGLVMGTRSGDLDPAIIQFLTLKEGYSLAEVETIFNKQSGLLGISGLTNDMRELIAEADEHDDRRAKLAIEIFCYRVRKYIGAYAATMGGIDGIVFTGGIGENSDRIRQKICEGLDWFGVKPDQNANKNLNAGKEGKFSASESKVTLWVIPTNEELLIARDTVRCIEKNKQN